MRFAILVMFVLAVLKLSDEFRRLLVPSVQYSAVDLKARYDEVVRWFSGEPVYRDWFRGHLHSLYPPATMVLLWPLIGWLDFDLVRWVWALTTIGALAWLVAVLVRESGANTRLEKIFVALMPLSLNATGVTIGNGQLAVHLVPLLVVGLLTLYRSRPGWGSDVRAAALVLCALAKPSLTVPFFWLALFTPARFRPAILIVTGYLGLSLLAASFQHDPLIPLLRDWLAQTEAMRGSGDSNLPYWLSEFGLKQWQRPGSVIALAALGIWVYRHRRTDPWIQLGVAALTARLWTYHRLYDDVIILLPMVALFRVASRHSDTGAQGVIAGGLLAITVFVMLIPARVHEFWPSPWPTLFSATHTVVWIATLIFLLTYSRSRRDLS
jgi:hypothetical protein